MLVKDKEARYEFTNTCIPFNMKEGKEKDYRQTNICWFCEQPTGENKLGHHGFVTGEF